MFIRTSRKRLHTARKVAAVIIRTNYRGLCLRSRRMKTMMIPLLMLMLMLMLLRSSRFTSPTHRLPFPERNPTSFQLNSSLALVVVHVQRDYCIVLIPTNLSSFITISQVEFKKKEWELLPAIIVARTEIVSG